MHTFIIKLAQKFFYKHYIKVLVTPYAIASQIY
jgi:hypothetical protein